MKNGSITQTLHILLITDNVYVNNMTVTEWQCAEMFCTHGLHCTNPATGCYMT